MIADNTLDLHGVRHNEVKLMVENFILLNQGKFPLSVICGNSKKMIDLVYEVTTKLQCRTDSFHYGVIIVGGFIC